MFKKIYSAFAILLSLTSFALAAGDKTEQVKNIKFPFDGVFGRFDQAQLQRGFHVFSEICSSCHGLRLVAFRTLGDEGGVGLTAAQVKAYASQFDVYNADRDEDVPASPADYFPESAVENAPDLSLMAKARGSFHDGVGFKKFANGIGGPEYIAALLQGYTGEEDENTGLYYNKYFGWISMAPPLEDGLVEFTDGAPNDLKHMSEDVAAFLMWAAEPKLMARKRWGLVMVTMFALMSILLFLVNKSLWAPIKAQAREER